MADFTTGAGATLGLTAAAPGSYTQAGYEALTPINIGKITNFGDIPSRTYQEVVVQYLEAEGEDVAKGGYSLGSQQLTIVLDGDDAGQALLEAAIKSKAAYTVKIDHPVLPAIWARALIMGGPKTLGDNNTAATWAVTIRYKVASLTNDGIVTVPK